MNIDQQLLSIRGIELVHPRHQLDPAQARLQELDALALFVDLSLVLLAGIHDRLDEAFSNLEGELLRELDRELALFVDRDPEAEAEFGVVLEE